ncbi:MAG: hypothetical protein ISS70_02545 [Phycisphaerae bacterium]|nr:hypothetical protein [Phycisphaerae bacterium]
MARFLILTFPVDGHVAPSIAIVRKLVERWRKVRWITGRIYEDRIKAIGAQFHPLPKEIDPEGKGIYYIFPQLTDAQSISVGLLPFNRAVRSAKEPIVSPLTMFFGLPIFKWKNLRTA